MEISVQINKFGEENMKSWFLANSLLSISHNPDVIINVVLLSGKKK